MKLEKCQNTAEKSWKNVDNELELVEKMSFLLKKWLRKC